MISRCIVAIIRRLPVRGAFVAHGAEIIKANMRDQNLEDCIQMMERVYMPLSNEALRRAAEHEKDGRARWGPFVHELDKISVALICAIRKQPFNDQRVYEVLSFTLKPRYEDR